PARPFAPLPRRRHLVACPLSNQLSLELREREQDVERQPPQRRARVELLGDGHEALRMRRRSDSSLHAEHASLGGLRAETVAASEPSFETCAAARPSRSGWQWAAGFSR